MVPFSLVGEKMIEGDCIKVMQSIAWLGDALPQASLVLGRRLQCRKRTQVQQKLDTFEGECRS